MDFNELLAQIAALGPDERPEDFLDQLGAAHGEFASAADAKINELMAADGERNSEIARLKAHNYDLLMAVQAQQAAELNAEDREDADDEPDDDDVNGPDDLFEDADD